MLSLRSLCIYCLVFLVLFSLTACNRKSSSSNAATKSWNHPNALNDNVSVAGSNASNPYAAIDSQGNWLVTWEQSDGSHNQIFKAEYRDRWWILPAALTSGISQSGTFAYSPRVAQTGPNFSVITWQQSDGTNSQIFKSEFRNNAWTHPSGLSDNLSADTTNATGPTVAVDDNHNAVVAWEQWDGSNWQVYRAVGQAGYWTLPSSLTEKISPSNQDVDDTVVAMDASGDAIIAWKQFDGSDWRIYMSERRGGIWSQPSGLTDAISPAGEDADDPMVVMAYNGRAAIFWEQYDGSNWQICKSDYINGAWTHPSGLTDNISPDGSDALGIDAAMNRYGHCVIVWGQDYSGNRRVYMAEYRGTSWSIPASGAQFISPDGSSAQVAAVAIDDSGNTVIAWEQSDGSHDQIYMSNYRDAAWSHPADLSVAISPPGQSVNFQGLLEMSTAGAAICVWTQSDGSHEQLYASQNTGTTWYHPYGLSNAFSVEGQSVSNPVMAMNGNGDIIIAWEQSDGSHDQIYISEYR